MNRLRKTKHGGKDAAEEWDSPDKANGSAFFDAALQDKAKESRKGLILFSIVFCAVMAYFYLSMMILILLLGAILYLILKKGLKWKGREFEISYIVILNCILMLFVLVSIAILSVYYGDIITDMISSPRNIYLLDFPLCASQIILASVFYGKRNKAVLTALLCTETVCVVMYGYNLVFNSHGPNQIGILLCYIAWRILAIFLMIQYLTGREPALQPEEYDVR
ncbi:hypothetical protein SAMN02745168_0344 [Papillibacter cinnamivorans DSM 12816]|uniref:Uncharacterized protein n=1 Tax=Papillibacter cinnamivorans DSM 12816 TaxID=1122930 RepID=A0A1W1YDD4_9FIRM|nr:hypothetical protein SAMN02745168_0344 [Papillibacter cinnamivorans DSM 12816]